nr:glycerophosphodiester phosphodiesterase family protein [Bacteroides intestinalis]
MRHLTNKKCICNSILWLFFLFFSLVIRANEYEATMSLRELFSPYTDMENGIKGIVDSGGKIEVKIFDKSTNTLVYHTYITSTSTTFTGTAVNYNKSSLGSGATYYPNVWNSKDIKIALGAIDRKRYDSVTTKPYHLFVNDIDLKVQINEINAEMNVCKIPGIGLIDRSGGNALFHPNHYCHDLKHAAEFVTRAWTRVKQPRMDWGADFIIATHRGVWGDNLGAGNPENSTAAIRDTKLYTDVLESDVMNTKDGELIISHDYNLKRLSDYSGSDEDYLYNMNASQIKNLHLRKRNMDVSEYKYLTFGDMIDALKKYELVLTVDIKEIRSRYDKNGNCIAACEYDVKQHGEAAKKLMTQSFMNILKKCVEIAEQKNALQYLAFKVNYSYAELSQYLTEEQMSKTLFMPVIHPDRENYLDFIDTWIRRAKKELVAWQTNFRKVGDPYLTRFTRYGASYDNLLHYVYENSGLRPGIYPEEPAGPRGVAGRYGEFRMKDSKDDMRGDHYFLMSIPYGKIMVLTTDRPDVCKAINELFNSMPQ